MRVVRLRTDNSEFVRTIQHIYPLKIKYCKAEQSVCENDLITKKFKNLDTKKLSQNVKVAKMHANKKVGRNNQKPCVMTRSGRKVVKPDHLTHN